MDHRSLAFLGFPDYRVRADGSVWSKRKRSVDKGKGPWRELKKRGRRYHVVSLRSDTQRTQVQVHTLMLLAFVGPKPDGYEARHFPDRNPQNNRIENLSWSDHSTNLADRMYHGTRNDVPSPGSKNGNAKLTEAMIPEIRKWGERKGPAFAAWKVKQKWGILISNVLAGIIIRRKAWKHVP